MVELVDTLVLGTSGVTRDSSSLSESTKKLQNIKKFQPTSIEFETNRLEREFPGCDERAALSAARRAGCTP